jgi:hypothetical protein
MNCVHPPDAKPFATVRQDPAHLQDSNLTAQVFHLLLGSLSVPDPLLPPSPLSASCVRSDAQGLHLLVHFLQNIQQFFFGKCSLVTSREPLAWELLEFPKRSLPTLAVFIAPGVANFELISLTWEAAVLASSSACLRIDSPIPLRLPKPPNPANRLGWSYRKGEEER